MKVTLLPAAVCSVAALCTVPAAGAGEPIGNPNRITVGGRAAFGVKAGFSSSLPQTGDPGPATGGGIRRTYDDGFVDVDSRGNADGQTWFWGYAEQSQANGVADTLTLSALTDAEPARSRDVEEDYLMGADVTYTRYLFEFGRANWGLELGGNFTPVSLSDNDTLTTTATAVHDAFALGGVFPPYAPYEGGYAEPGHLLGDAPLSRSTSSHAASFAGRREIESTTFGLRVGPSLDIPMGVPLSLQISGGAYVLYADSKFTYQETLSVDGVVRSQTGGRVTEQDWMLGAYVRGQVLVALSHTVGLFVGAEYLVLDTVELRDGTHRATLDFGDSFAGMLGVAFTF